MEKTWGLLLDLDQTLVLTNALLSLREQRQWSTIHNHFHKTDLPEHTLAFIQRVQPHVHIGVVTASPRSYAEKLLRHHNLDIPVLTAYHDTRKHKPEPDPLLHAAQRLGLSPGRCIHVGDHEKDIVAAHKAGMVSIGITWDRSLVADELKAYTYTLCTNWSEVVACIRNTLKRG